MKTKKCTLGIKHKWEFIENITNPSIIGSSATLTLCGKYRCACGEVKYGKYVMEYKE